LGKTSQGGGTTGTEAVIDLDEQCGKAGITKFGGDTEAEESEVSWTSSIREPLHDDAGGDSGRKIRRLIELPIDSVGEKGRQNKDGKSVRVFQGAMR
jgi:hypothetical protein